MFVLTCKNVSLSFGTDKILDKIDFEADRGDRIGIVGVNGAGKSSLFKIICGDYRSDTGEVFYQGKMGCLYQQSVIDSEKTIFEEMLSVFGELTDMESKMAEYESKELNAAQAEKYSSLCERYRAMGGYEYRGRIKSILKKFGFEDDDRKTSSLSGGQKTSLALVRLILSAPDILLLDEPTNHLDVETIEWLEEYINSLKGTTVIIISHDRYFLDKVTNKTYEIENTHGKMYKGSYSAFVDIKAKNREIYQKHYDNQQKEIKRLEAYIEQQRRWNRERNIIAAESRQKAIDRMEKLDRPESDPEKIHFSFMKAPPCGNDVLTVDRLSMAFGDNRLFSELSLDIKRGNRLFIAGRNGCGKSTLLKILVGRQQAQSGMYKFGYGVKYGFFEQEYSDLDPSKTVLDELWDAHPELPASEIRGVLALFIFKGDDVEKRVSSLSGGEKARLVLAKLILSKINLLILDEPTNHLDIISREILEDALLKIDGTIIAVSHDRYFVRKLAKSICHITKGAGGKLYNMDYESYLEKRDAEVEPVSEKKSSAGKAAYLEEKEKRSQKNKLARKLERTEERILELEQRQADIESEMNTSAATDYKRLGDLEEERQRICAELDGLYNILDELDGE